MKNEEFFQAVKTIDKILTTEDEHLKSSWREFMSVVTLTEEATEEDGPLMAILNHVDRLEKRIISMEKERSDYYRWREREKMMAAEAEMKMWTVENDYKKRAWYDMEADWSSETRIKDQLVQQILKKKN